MELPKTSVFSSTAYAPSGSTTVSEEPRSFTSRSTVSVRITAWRQSSFTEEPVAAPQHVFIAPDGTLFSSAVYRVTKGELEWMWIEAIKRVNPDVKLPLSSRARAPKAFVGGGKPMNRMLIEKTDHHT